MDSGKLKILVPLVEEGFPTFTMSVSVNFNYGADFGCHSRHICALTSSIPWSYNEQFFKDILSYPKSRYASMYDNAVFSSLAGKFPDILEYIRKQAYSGLLGYVGEPNVLLMSDRVTRDTSEKNIVSITGFARHLCGLGWFMMASPIMSNKNYHSKTSPTMTQTFLLTPPTHFDKAVKGTEVFVNYDKLNSKDKFDSYFTTLLSYPGFIRGPMNLQTEVWKNADTYWDDLKDKKSKKSKELSKDSTV